MTDYGYLLPSRRAVIDAESSTDVTAGFNELIDLGVTAEEQGYEMVWIGDSVTARPRPEPLVTLSSLVTATDTIGLGTAVYLPNLRHPLSIAHQTTTLQHLSNNRFEFGVGVGSPAAAGKREHEHFDVPFDQRGAVMTETLALVTELWDGPVDSFEGDFFQIDDADIGFQPTEKPPVHIASTFNPDRGFPQSILRRVAKYGQGWLPGRLTPQMYEKGLNRLFDAIAHEDRSPDSLERLYYLDVLIEDDQSLAIEQADSFKQEYYPRWSGSQEEIDSMVAHGAYGSPDTVADRISEYKQAGVDRFVIRFPTTEQREQLDKFEDAIVSS